MVGMLQKGADKAPWRWELQGTGCKGTSCGAINPLKSDTDNQLSQLRISEFFILTSNQECGKVSEHLGAEAQGYSIFKDKNHNDINVR